MAVRGWTRVACPTAFRIGEPRAVRGSVIAVAGREIPPRQERVARGRASQPTHIVEGEYVPVGSTTWVSRESLSYV